MKMKVWFIVQLAENDRHNKKYNYLPRKIARQVEWNTEVDGPLPQSGQIVQITNSMSFYSYKTVYLVMHDRHPEVAKRLVMHSADRDHMEALVARAEEGWAPYEGVISLPA